VIAAQAVERPVSKRVTYELVSLRSKSPRVPQEPKIHRPPSVALDEPPVTRARHGIPGEPPRLALRKLGGKSVGIPALTGGEAGILTDYAVGEAQIADALELGR
jgi:hypothetical protein